MNILKSIFYGTISSSWIPFFQIKTIISNIVKMFSKRSQFSSENIYYICFSFPQSYYLKPAFEKLVIKSWTSFYSR